jgi:tetratricopeptide (TPR) repeat protein
MNEEKSLCYSDILGLGEFTIFCGAGISKNSGLPLAGELTKCILDKLLIDKEDIEEIIKDSNLSLPFEAFMETLSENSDISRMLDIFEKGVPNTNHILMARLAKNDNLKTIFTTNFDLLIEDALKDEGLEKGKDFEVYCNEEQFSGIDFENIEDGKVRIFKIHGSVDNRDSIRTTMKAVASKSLSDKRMNLIRYLFSTGNHKKVLVLGYSCSDEFDITPQIQSIEENKKEIIFVEHFKKEEIEIEDIKNKEEKNPFKTFQGKMIKCYTDHFISGLWDSLNKIVGEYKFIESKVDWEICVDDWGKGFRENKEYLENRIPGLVLYKISRFRKAVKYHEKALEIARATPERKKVSTCCTSLGNAHWGLADYKTAAKYYEESLKINEAIGDEGGKLACYTNLGVALDYLEDFKEAIEYFKAALNVEKSVRDAEKKAACYGGLGSAYNGLKDFKKGIKYSEKGLKIAEAIGDKEREEKCYLGLGVGYYGLKNFSRAIEYWEKGLKIAEAIGDEGVKSAFYTLLSSGYEMIGNHKKAEDYKRKLKEK